MSDLEVVEARDQDGAVWDRYVTDHPEASHYHRFGWRGLIRRVFGQRCYYFLARDSAGAVRGVMPAVRLTSRLFGDYLVSMPYFNYGGALADDAAGAQALLCAAADRAQQLRLDHFEARHVKPLQPAWPSRADKLCMYLELPASEEVLFQGLGSKMRSQIKRPVREGATVHEGGAELLDDFYRVFARNMRDLGTPVYGRDFFAEMLHTWPDDSRILSVRIGGIPAAAAFLLGWKERLEIPWASSLREYNRISVNMLLYGEVLKYAIRTGYRIFDFGRSTLDAGTHRFKKQWGAQPVPLCWEYWLPQGKALPELRPDSPKFRLAVAVWQRLPLAVANRIGPHIVRNLP